MRTDCVCNDINSQRTRVTELLLEERGTFISTSPGTCCAHKTLVVFNCCSVEKQGLLN